MLRQISTLIAFCPFFLPYAVSCFSLFDPFRTTPADSSDGLSASVIKPRGEPPSARSVYVVADIAPHPVVISSEGKNLLTGHSFLWVAGNDQDGAIRIEAVQPSEGKIALRFLDYTVQFKDKNTLPLRATGETVRKMWRVGTTEFSNADFADPKTGKGLVLDAWAEDPVFVQGANCGNQLVKSLVEEKLSLKVSPAFNTFAEGAKEYAQRMNLPLLRQTPALYLQQVKEWGINGLTVQSKFGTTDAANPNIEEGSTVVEDSDYLADTAVPSEDIMSQPLLQPGEGQSDLPSPFTDAQQVELSSTQAAAGGSDASNDQLISDGSTSFDSIHETGNSAQAVTLVRIGGVASNVRVVLESTARAVGVAGLAIAPLFIILDFVNGDFKGGAFGAVGLTLGILTVVALPSPIGWVLGGLAALFYVLPTLFNHPTSAFPHANNATEIIQYAMFGDLTHTGNEKCREQNPNCTALYGPGIIAAAFKWDNFDPIAFLLQYNQGYAMTVPEMASAFDIVDSSKDGTEKIATISCNPPTHPCTRFVCPPVDKSLCGKATFALNRPLITLPVLNQTADKIYQRLIPNAGGDCKLINDVSGTEYPDYNITVTGAPAAIACNVTASIEINGAISLINDTNANNGLPAAFNSPANASTDGSIHEVAAPSPIGFLPALNSSNAICLSGSGGSMCFPNGTYPIQTGIFGFDSSKVNSLSLPPGASLAFTVPAIGKPHTALSLKPWTYTTNQPATSKAFGPNFNSIAADAFGPRTFTTVIADGPPVACLFSETQYQGDVICYGVGSGNVSANVVDVPQSLALHGNATVWVYGNYYGDDGGQLITTDIADLSSVPLGADENFTKRIKALWVVGG